MQSDDAFSVFVVHSGMVGKHTYDCFDLKENDQNSETKIQEIDRDA
jgi:hypothetical protein